MEDRIIHAISFLRTHSDFPLLSSEYIENNSNNEVFEEMHGLNPSLEKKIEFAFSPVSRNANKLRVCFVACIDNDISYIYDTYWCAMHNIFEQFDLELPESESSLFDELEYNSLLDNQVLLLAEEKLAFVPDFDIYDFSEEFSFLAAKEKNSQGFEVLYKLSVILERYTITAKQLEALQPQTLFSTLRFLRIGGLKSARHYTGASVAGAVATAKQLGISLYELIKYGDIITSIYGYNNSNIADTLITSSRNKLILHYNSINIYNKLAALKKVRDLIISYVLHQKIGVFNDLLRQCIQKCSCYYINQLSDFCPKCLFSSILSSLRINCKVDDIFILLKVIQEINAKKHNLACNSANDANECLQCTRAIFEEENVIQYIAQQNSEKSSFLRTAQAICRAIRSSRFFDGKFTQNCDYQTIQLAHKLYALSWIQLSYCQHKYGGEKSLTRYLEQRDISVLSQPDTDEFEVYEE